MKTDCLLPGALRMKQYRQQRNDGSLRMRLLSRDISGESMPSDFYNAGNRRPAIWRRRTPLRLKREIAREMLKNRRENNASSSFMMIGSTINLS